MNRVNPPSTNIKNRRTTVDLTMVRRLGFAVGLMIFALICAPPAKAETITIFAAASLTEAVQEIAAAHPRFKWRMSFASSSVLANQIQAGGPADIYLSANERWMDYLVKVDAIRAADRTALLSNRLALIAPADSNFTIRPAPNFPLERALDGGWLALGDPDHVPGGIYAKQALTNLGVWQSVARKIAPMNHIRAALNLVARGEAAAGIVYATDAKITNQVRIVALLPQSSHSPIIYSAAIVAQQDRPAARQAFAVLTSASAATIFRRHGFIVLPRKDQ